MAVFLSPIFGAGVQLFDDQGRVLAGGSISTFLAGTSTPQTTYTDSTGLTPNGPIITLDAAGRTPQEIWIPGGVSLKFIVKNSSGVQQGQNWDNVQGLNDPAFGASISQWVSTGLTPTYISATQFSVLGNQTSIFQPGRRIRYTLGSGQQYGIISASVFTTVTTVTIRADVTGLDNTLSAVDVGLLTSVNSSVPFAPSFDWISTGLTPTYISATQFSVPGNQTSVFQVGRRVRYTVGSGTLYGIITASAFTTVTTVTIRADVTGLDNTLSVVDVSLLTSINPSEPFTPSWGTYTPSFALGINLTSVISTGPAYWSRSGNMVTVSGEFTITPTTGGSTDSNFTSSIPIPSAFAQTSQAAGGAFSAISIDPCKINAGAGNVEFSFRASTNGAKVYSYIYQYLLI